MLVYDCPHLGHDMYEFLSGQDLWEHLVNYHRETGEFADQRVAEQRPANYHPSVSHYVRRREDLRKADELLPLKFGKHQALDEWMPAIQPDELDDSEFNLILFKFDDSSNALEVYDVAIAIDFEDKEVR